MRLFSGNATGNMIASPIGKQFAANGSDSSTSINSIALKVFHIHPSAIDQQGFIVDACDSGFEMQAIMQLDALRLISIFPKQVIHLINSRLVAARGHAHIDIFPYNKHVAAIHCSWRFDEDSSR